LQPYMVKRKGNILKMKFSFKHSIKWSIFISVVTFILGGIFSVASTILLEDATWGVGMGIVFIFILIGILFDMMGLASASAEEKPFHAMASEKVSGSQQAIGIVRNADRFSNFCNDVIGDISGIVSGAASAAVVIKMLTSMNAENAVIHSVVSVVISGLVAAFTVGGKALGKSFAIHYATDIVLVIGKFFYFLEQRIGIRIFKTKKNKTGNGKRGKKRAARSNSST